MIITDYITTTNYTDRGGQEIDRLTVHCVVGQLPAIQVAKMFTPQRKASANYIIGKDGEVVRNVPEQYRAWTSGTGNKKGSNDMRAITIEVASDTTKPYAFNNKAYSGLVDLAVDICKRYNKHLVWIPNKQQALNYVCKKDEMLITLHRWFQAVECPGDWFINKLPTFVNDVNKKIVNSAPVNNDKLYRVQVGAFRSKENAEKFLKEVKAKGFTDSFIV
jgi:hypothetical protein